mgnify:FL=1
MFEKIIAKSYAADMARVLNSRSIKVVAYPGPVSDALTGEDVRRVVRHALDAGFSVFVDARSDVASDSRAVMDDFSVRPLGSDDLAAFNAAGTWSAYARHAGITFDDLDANA